MVKLDLNVKRLHLSGRSYKICWQSFYDLLLSLFSNKRQDLNANAQIALLRFSLYLIFFFFRTIKTKTEAKILPSISCVKTLKQKVKESND